jgi:Tfp pilus assembly protein FimV
MSLDTRGFVDELESLRQQATWQLDSLQTELAASLRQLQQLQAEQQAHRQQVEALSAWLKPSATKPLNPTLARQGLAYLTQANRQAEQLQQAIERAEADCTQQQERCRSQQLKLEALERHREEGLRSYGAQQQNKAAFVADADWVMRSQWIKRLLQSRTHGRSTS